MLTNGKPKRDQVGGSAPSQADVFSIEFISGIFIVIGLGAFAWLFISINRDTRIIAATQSGLGAGTTILAFLDSFGIIIPLLAIGLGAFIFRLGLRLRQWNAEAAQWAQTILLWLSIGVAVVILQSITAGIADEDGSFLRGISWALPWIIIEALFVFALYWLRKNLSEFGGEQQLSAASTRTAWNLLIPTVAILIVVAARPLEQTFIASLTDAEFGTAQTEEEVQFVGFSNYAQLLGVRLDALPCETDDSGACVIETNEDGTTEVQYQSVRDVIGDDLYRGQGFREVSSFNLFGTQYAFSARDRDFMDSIGNTLVFSFFSVIIELIVGLFIAIVVNSRFPGRGLLRAAMLVPWAIPTVVSARLWQVMLRDNQSGVINAFLTGTGLIDSPQAWLANPDTQLWSLVAIDVWKTTPFMALILLAGLQTISGDLYEAADVDGASKVRQFFQITIPLLRPTIAVALVFRTLDAVRVFDVFNVLLQRQKLSMATYNYETLVQNQQLGYASAIGVTIFIIIVTLTVIY
ncbi:MAG: sugar ABC transporter permease, partial [Burkholderiales bacterium]|nr:sugar ABC transporter permease [Anaerolineae bacterium]